MTNVELLNSNRHSQLRLMEVDQEIPQFVPIVTSEFSNASQSCPILFAKDPQTGGFIVGAVFSLKSDEPPLKTSSERGGFIPLSYLCRGFYISGDSIVIDRDDQRFCEADGDLMFTDTQQPADCLRKIQNALGELHAFEGKTNEFVKTMMDHKLIEPIDLSFEFDSGERLSLRGLYTLSLDSLGQLDDSTLVGLVRSGHMELIYTMSISLKQFNSLAYVRNKKAGFNPSM